MSKGNLNLKEISDVKLRDDGNEAQMTFIGKNNQSLTVTLTFEQLQALETHILNLLVAGRFNRGTHSDTPKAFNAPREVLLVNDLELHLPPDGGTTF